ncbi:MAG TPA: hypothetical protein VMT85_12645 [Thermoanaerobaculia bacterium]|nr:hypothetical protein [Thermoanaerobaculia bacterium]
MSATRPLTILALVTLASSAVAEQRITFGTEPIGTAALRSPSRYASTLPAGGEARAVSTPSSGPWFINYFQVDETRSGDATLFAVRNHDTGPVAITVTYFDTRSPSPQTEEHFTIPVRGVLTRNTRDVPRLVADNDGLVRGSIRVDADGPVSVDFFQVFGSDDFATGDAAATVADICDLLTVRFMDFGGERASSITVLVGEPGGFTPADRSTLVGQVYDEDGDFVNSFSVHSDEASFVVPIRSIVREGSTLFGSIEIDAAESDGAIVYVTHSAHGRFSVSHPAVCIEATGSGP